MEETRSPAGDLGRLIDTERRSEAILDEARKKAEEILRLAREAAASEDGVAAEETERAARGLESRLAAERKLEEETIGAEARRLVRLYDSVPENAVGRLADHVVARLIAEPATHDKRPP